MTRDRYPAHFHYIFYKGLLSLVILAVFSVSAYAQSTTGSVEAVIKDKTSGEALSHATVVVRKAADSAVVKTAAAGDDGSFRLTGIDTGRYILQVTYLGYAAYSQNLSISGSRPDVNLGTLQMSTSDVALNTVVVADQAPPVKIIKDTIQFNADSYKTKENAVVEDLLKKLPGVEVDKDGNVTAQGEQVQQVLVDGKPFFGDDPKISTKNLPADIIDKVQLFDKTSDQAAFTGINDGNTTKAINLIIKKDKKKGLFGRATVGYGSDNRYQVNAMLNHFKGSQQISFIGGGNNVNNLGFSFNDVRSIMGGGRGGGGGGRGGGGIGGAIAPIGGGITTNWMGGLNYRDNFGSKLQVYGSFFSNYTNKDAEEKSSQENILPDTSFFYNQHSISNNKSWNQRMNLNIEYTIDSMSSIIFRPNISYTTNDYAESNEYESLGADKGLVNNGSNNFSSHNTSPNLNGSLLYRRRFNKKGRSFSISVDGGYNSNDATAFNRSNSYFFKGGDSLSSELIDQKNILNSHSGNWGASISYTEPLYQDHFLEFEYSHSENNSYSDKLAYNFNGASKIYDELDSTYSNSFHNTFNTDRGSINFVANKEKYDYTIGLRLQQSRQRSDWETRDSVTEQNSLNLSPLFNFHYEISQYSRLRLQYNGNTQQPSLSQLQPVPDNSDPLNIKLGNPDLKPSFANSLSINYNMFDPVNYKSMFVSLNFRDISNQIVTSSYYNDSAQQITKPVNVNGIYSMNGNVSLSLPVQKWNLKIHPSTSANYSHNVGFVNNEKNISKNLTLRQRLSFSYDLGDILDLDLGGSVNYNKVSYSLQPNQNTNYFDYNFSTDFELHLLRSFLLGSDFDYTVNTGRAAGYNQSVAMLNPYLGKEFFKNKQGMLKFQVFDLLNQNVSIERNIGATYIEDTETKVLSRYFLLTFTYNLKNFGGRGMRGGGEGGPRRFDGGGWGGGGGFPRR